MENFKEKFSGTKLESYAERLDAIVEMVQDGQLSKDEAAELVEDIKTEQEVYAMTASMQLKSDFIRSIDLLMKVL